jgi:uridine kinase
MQAETDIASLLRAVARLPPTATRPCIIAISGFGGAGKTTLASTLKEHLKDAQTVSIDSFSTHEWRRNEDWDNFDRDRFIREVLEPARVNRFPLVFAHEPWPGHVAEPAARIPRAKFLIVEGCSILHPALLGYYDYKIWVDCDLQEATRRGMWRDRYVHNDEQDHYWQTIWMPNDRDFFNKYRPDNLADERARINGAPRRSR